MSIALRIEVHVIFEYVHMANREATKQELTFVGATIYLALTCIGEARRIEYIRPAGVGTSGESRIVG